jgi:hypothetical protein
VRNKVLRATQGEGKLDEAVTEQRLGHSGIPKERLQLPSNLFTQCDRNTHKFYEKQIYLPLQLPYSQILFNLTVFDSI